MTSATNKINPAASAAGNSSNTSANSWVTPNPPPPAAQATLRDDLVKIWPVAKAVGNAMSALDH
jgi:hypothetical protein